MIYLLSNFGDPHLATFLDQMVAKKRLRKRINLEPWRSSSQFTSAMSKLYKNCPIRLGPFVCSLRCWYNSLVRFPIESVKTVSGKPVSSREACMMESLSCSVKAIIMQITVRIDCMHDKIFFCDLRVLYLASFYLLTIICHSTIKLNLKCIAKEYQGTQVRLCFVD